MEAELHLQENRMNNPLTPCLEEKKRRIAKVKGIPSTSDMYRQRQTKKKLFLDLFGR